MPDHATHSSISSLLGALVLIAMGTGCSAVDPAAPNVALNVQQVSVPNPLAPPAATVTVGRGSLDIAGYLTTPYPCYQLTADAEQSGATLTVTLTAASNGSACAAVITPFGFTAHVAQVPGSTSHVRVQQTGAVSGFPTVLLDQDVAMP